MKTLTKTQKIVRWASEKKTRSFSKAMKELGYTRDRQLRLMVNHLVRNGLINAEFTGKKVALRMTQETYFNRASLVIAR